MELSRREGATLRPISRRDIAWPELVDPDTYRFTPGTHIRVRRRLGYFHHGIYVADDEVIQFGGRIMDKPTATVGAVSLAAFENGGREDVPGSRWWALGAPSESVGERESEQRVQAEEGADLVAFGVPGGGAEVGCVFAVVADQVVPVGRVVGREPASAADDLLGCLRGREPRWRGKNQGSQEPAFAIVFDRLGAAAKTLLSLTTITLYNWNIRRFWVDIGRQWRIYEQSLNS